MKPKSVSAFSKSLLPAVFCLAISAAAHAANLTWDNGAATGNWNTTDANWTTATWNNGTPDSAIFDSTGVGTVTLTEGISVDDITFNTAGYTVSGSTLTLLGGGSSIVTANANAIISSDITSGRLDKNGSATLTLSGTNSYSGGTVINGGTLEIASMSNIGSGFLAMDNTSTLRYTGTGAESTGRDIWINNAAGTRTFEIVDAGATLTLASGGGSIIRDIRKSGDGTLALGRVTTGGNTTISAGVLEVTTSGKLYGSGYTSTPVISVASGGTLRLNGWSWDAAGSIANLDYSRDRLVVNGGTIEYTGASNLNPGDPGSSSRNLTIGTGGATLKASSASGQTWTITSGNGNLINNNGLTLDGAGAGVIQKVIEGSGDLTKTGAGTWTLSGANTYTGTTTVSAGTLSITSSALASASSVVIDLGATLNLDFSGNAIVSGLEINGSGTLPDGAYNSGHPIYGSYFTGAGTLLVVTGASGTWSSLSDGNWEEPTNWEAGTIATGFDQTATFNKATGVTVTLSGSQTIGNLAFSVSDYTIAGPGALTLDASGTPGISVATDRTATISANIAGTIGLEKTGDGTLVFTGTKSYTGGTTVTGGTLELQGATGGNAQIHGSLTVGQGATVLFTGGDGTGFGFFNNPVTSVYVDGGTIDAAGSSHLGFGLSASMTLDNGGTLLGSWQWNGSGLLSFASFGDSTNTIDATLNLRNDAGANHPFDVANGASATDLLISGTLAGSGANVVKNDGGTMVLSGVNTYTGNTVVNDGALEVTSIGSLRFRPTASGVTNNVSGSATATLSFLGTVDLDLSAANLADGNSWTLFDLASFTGPAPVVTPTDITSTAGTFGKSGTTWTLIDGDNTWTFEESTGVLSLAVAASNDYETWGSTYGLTAGSEGGDLDNDGLSNFEEYAFGLLPNSGSSVNPIAAQLNKTTGKFSYTRRDITLQNPALTYTVWYSTDLATWTEDTGAGQSITGTASEVDTVEVTLTPALLSNPKLFIQVRAATP